MAALLSTEIGNTDKIVFNIVECRRQGIAGAAAGRQRERLGILGRETADDGTRGRSFRPRRDQERRRGRGPGDPRRAAQINRTVGSPIWRHFARRSIGQVSTSASPSAWPSAVPWIASVRAPGSSAPSTRRSPPGNNGRRQARAVRWDSSTSGAARRSPPNHDWSPARREIYARQAPGLGKGVDRDVSERASLAEVLETSLTRRDGQIVVLAERPSGDKVRLIGMINSVRRITTKTNRTMAVDRFRRPDGQYRTRRVS